MSLGVLAACSDGGGATGSGGSGGTGTTTGTAGTTSAGGSMNADAIAVNSTTKVIPADGTFTVKDGAKIPILTEDNNPFTIQNKSGGEITISAIELVKGGDIQDEEFVYEDKDIKPNPFKSVMLKDKEKFDFYLRFQPVQSGARSATVKITFTGAASGNFNFKYEGNGTDSAKFLTDPKNVKQLLFGSSSTSLEDMMGTLVADASGNAYISATIDAGSSDDLLLYQIKADGTLGWSKVFSADSGFSVRDSGQNGETGGPQGSLTMGSDGKLYLVADADSATQNNSFYTYVAKIDPADGKILWEKIWARAALIKVASDSSRVWAVDASAADNVYITGATSGEASIFALALKKSDGSLLFQKEIEPDAAKKTNDRGYAVRYDTAAKALYIAGQTDGKNGSLIKLKSADTANPTIEWAKAVPIGVGGNFNALDLDGQGNVYVGVDIRGGYTALGVASFDKSGSKRWAKQYQGLSGDKNNTHALKILDGSVYLGGRVAGAPAFDGQMGDGCLLKLNPADGAEQKAAFYYSGKKAEQLSEHRVKGFALVGDQLLVGMQAYTGTMNGVRFWGYWYEKGGMLSDYALSPADETKITVTDIPAGVVSPPTSVTPGKPNIAGLKYGDVDMNKFKFQPAQAKKDGVPPDAELLFVSMPKL
jgi:hypothetical protein